MNFARNCLFLSYTREKAKLCVCVGMKVHRQIVETFSCAENAFSMTPRHGNGSVILRLMERWDCSDVLDFTSVQEKLMQIIEKFQKSFFIQQEEQIPSFTCNLEGNKEK